MQPLEDTSSIWPNCRHRCEAAAHIRVGNATAMPKLAKDAAASLVDGVCHLTPTLDLIIPPQARTIDDALALLGHSGAFGYDQTRCGALGIIVFHDERRDVVRRSRGSSSSPTSRCDWEARGREGPLV